MDVAEQLNLDLREPSNNASHNEEHSIVPDSTVENRSAPPGDSGPESSSGDGGDASTDEENSYQYCFKALSNQWLHSQLTHHVSLAACNSFWNLAMQNIPKLMEMKKNERVTRKIPQFTQVSRCLLVNLLLSRPFHMLIAL